ncbi:acyl-CoA carboxylase epsilon subunit [Humibacter ginsenosidimutans]|uniref:Acyl-CoA carboxylase subunit epsilon n=1 Tax=Humibacter ginsenosidimutans TaxID=2599293 RepID=A0A5B8M7N3_9MICO|nr:acyl-CoA carboxylase epsilon subunit [Humibacter ginsenosidimutans]QDZ16406.1 hypothetical protein FPZ11_18105 [Humibacter ginsenosidimutans]
MAKHSSEPEVDASQLVFHTRHLSEDEIAAVTAVITAALREQASREEPTEDAAPSAWQRGRRNLRMPLTRGAGAWRSWG